jgi:hypothetical protein
VDWQKDVSATAPELRSLIGLWLALVARHGR